MRKLVLDVPPEGTDVEIPFASVIHHEMCGDPNCRAVHILLKNEEGEGLAQATVSLEMIITWLKTMYSVPGSPP